MEEEDFIGKSVLGEKIVAYGTFPEIRDFLNEDSLNQVDWKWMYQHSPEKKYAVTESGINVQSSWLRHLDAANDPKTIAALGHY